MATVEVLTRDTASRWVGDERAVQDTMLSVTIPSEMKRMVFARAEADGKSVSRWVREQLVAGLGVEGTR